jgi:peptidoglycan/LPS O-acetylase OafA/YrhL
VDGQPKRVSFLPSIEGARGIAALGVLTYHVSLFTHGPLRSIADRFWLGVPLFFLISGFLLYRPFAHATLYGTKRPSLGRYARARALRIVPAYWLILTLTIVVDGAHAGRVHGGGLVASNYLLAFLPFGKPAIVPPAWTLCIEALFYVFLPFLAIAAARLAANTATPRARARCLIALLLLAFPVAYAYMWFVGAGGSYRSTYPTSLAAYLDEFAAGMVLAVIVERRHSISATASRVMLAAGVAIAAVANVEYTTGRSPYATHNGFMLSRLMVIAFALTIASVVMRDERPAVGRLLSSRPLVAAGTVSYGVYLWHSLLIEYLSRTALWWSPVTDLLLIAALTLVVSAFSWVALERPLLKLKNGWPGWRHASEIAPVCPMIVPIGAEAKSGM